MLVRSGSESDFEGARKQTSTTDAKFQPQEVDYSHLSILELLELQEDAKYTCLTGSELFEAKALSSPVNEVEYANLSEEERSKLSEKRKLKLEALERQRLEIYLSTKLDDNEPEQSLLSQQRSAKLEQLEKQRKALYSNLLQNQTFVQPEVSMQRKTRLEILEEQRRAASAELKRDQEREVAQREALLFDRLHRVADKVEEIKKMARHDSKLKEF